MTWAAEWAGKEAATATDMADVARAITLLRATSLLTDETLLRLLSHILPDFDVAAELEALAKQRPDEVERMGRLAQDNEDEDEDGDETE